MTPEQHQTEAARASVLHSQAAGRIYDNTQGAMADIHRRVISEPWYGRDVFDNTWERQMGYAQGQDTGNVYGPAKEESAINSFYGNGPGHNPGKDAGRGIEP